MVFQGSLSFRSNSHCFVEKEINPVPCGGIVHFYYAFVVINEPSRIKPKSF